MDIESRNAEGYSDPTAYNALINIESRARAKRLIADILRLIEENDFELVDRIHLYDRRAGREYRREILRDGLES